MSPCAVKGCHSKSSRGSSLRFYSLPVSPTRRQLWLSKIQLKRKFKEGATVCGLHFKPEDFDECDRLKCDAVPDVMMDCGQNCEIEEVCRICLALGRKMYDIRDHRLEQAYKDISGMTVSSDDRLPQVLCWECKARLLSAAIFQGRTRTAHDLLSGLLKTYGSITAKSVRSINRSEQRLASHLSEKHIKPNEYIHLNEVQLKDISDIISDNNDEKKEAYDETTDVDTIEDNFDALDDSDHISYENEITNVSLDIKIDAENENDTDDIKNDLGTVQEHHEVNNDGLTKEMTVKKSKVAPRVRSKRKAKADITVSKRNTPEYMKDFTVTKLTKEEEIAEIIKRKETTAYKEAAYKCNVCYRGYVVQSCYEEHVLRHTEKYGTAECDICKIRKPTAKEVLVHKRILHGKRYSCNKCSYVTQSQPVAKNHHRHHAQVTYDCPHCSQQFARMSTYYGHLRKKHLCDCPCEFCGHTFLSDKGKLYHQKITHRFDKDKMPLSGPHCATCDVTFASRAAHDTHLTMSSRHNDDSTSKVSNTYRLSGQKRGRPKGSRQPVVITVTCEQCGQRFPTKRLYVGHFEQQHPDRTRTQHVPRRAAYRFMCEHCGRKFSAMATLQEHMPVHSGIRGFECHICGKKFVKKPSLVSHLTIHSDQRESYECGVCHKLFTNISSRHKHFKSSHANVKPYECEACGKRFVVPSLLRAHIDHVHNKVPWPKKNRTRLEQ